MLKIAMVTNSLAPYRVPIYARIAQKPGIQLHLFCCSEREPNRLWDLPPIHFDFTVLRERFLTFRKRYIHNNLDIVGKLQNFEPDVVITDGFNPTHLYAFLYARMNRVPHVAMTDGTDMSEKGLSVVHKLIRYLVYSKSDAFISASQGGYRLYGRYGITLERCFTSFLCADNEAYANASASHQKQFDFIFCGRIESVKNPLFAIEVCAQLAKRLNRRVKILFVGYGAMEETVKLAAASFQGLIEADFYGCAKQGELPGLYRSAKIFLFPTLWDPWGVVVNEACAAGLPVLVSPFAGAANELVRNGENGYICGLDVDAWTDKAEYLLAHPEIYQKFSERSQALVKQYTFDSASKGIVAACQYAWSARARKDGKDTKKTRPRVVIVERQLLQYRVTFYNRLRALLDEAGIELQLLIGTGTPDEEKKMNQVALDWTIQIPTHYLFGETLCWQPFGSYARDADLVIVMHENKIIYNLWLLSFGRPKRLAFWGHGRNMQSDHPTGLKERFKRWTVNKVDWWFAYTESSADLITGAGFPRECTTVVENAVDTEELTALCEQVSAAVCQRKREELKLGDGPIGLYLGSLYKEKRLDFLLEAAFRIQEKIPDFQLLVVGAGPEREKIESAAAVHSWIHYLGPLQDQNKAVALVLADVMLNPGLVGLGILDSFASGTPMITTDCGLHSPEISYMTPGKNGVITSNDVGAYADAVINILSQPDAIARLSKGALSSAPHYTVDNMAERIRRGICACLASPRPLSKGHV